ncbi:uncharacterized protein M6B38_176965 [Iris pallida]|uniref:CCHC-type domain-containing protein n=1 Tax=Iris pallida TaxID=29817 RepID=A0AAX6EPT1_IRIPA|nr:uncharacterized protein M6B38_176965 [Iris pallida]
MSYAEAILPLAAKEDWSVPHSKVLPPILKRQPGRPRVARRRDPSELVAAARRQNKCSSCGTLGHNKANCRGPTGSTKEPRKRIKTRGGSTQTNSNQRASTSTVGETLQ